nr:sensor histidine kinase [Nocardioides sp. zg-DK7169]
MGVGLGLIACFLHATLHRRPDSLSAYRSARTLIGELLDLSGGLDSGLDPQVLGGALLSTVGDTVATRTLVLLVPRNDDGGCLTPLVAVQTTTEHDSAETDLDLLGEIAEEARRCGHLVLHEDRFAVPLVADAVTTVGVVAGLLPGPAATAGLDSARFTRLLPSLTASAVRLETALLFRALRDSATAEERRRLAREMHDGIAQDIASLGYLLDLLAARPASPAQAEQFEALRTRISSVVTEVRRSVESLRTDVGASESLGAAIATLARNLGEAAGIPIKVTTDERTTRLRPEVEAELFRITQEALNNAVRHARASRIDVHCLVHAPRAAITVADDGLGLQQSRRDSYGLKIMQERADLVHADLEIDNRDSGGLVVSIRLPTVSQDPVRPPRTSDTVSV